MTDVYVRFRSIVLYGVGSPVVVDVEESLTRARVSVTVAVRNVEGEAWTMGDLRIIGRTALGPDILADPFLVPLFAPGHRQMAAAEAVASGFTVPFTLIDPTAVTPGAFAPGPGSYINAGCTIGSAGCFGEFTFVNRGASICHHAQFDRFVSIGPGAVLAGQVHVGKGSVIGAGAVVLPGLRIGANAVVGAGAVVTKDVPDHAMAMGNPARIVKTGIAGYRDLTVT
jgi:sugar O-acyltransferase (sialic acid O-acetyltransferase NeuD family)